MASAIKDVHEVKPGAMGVVAHEWPFWNVWTPRPATKQNDQSYFCFEDKLYELSGQIKHGTFVLVISEHEFTLSGGTKSSYYRVIWGDLVCFIRRDLIINPYINNE